MSEPLFRCLVIGRGVQGKKRERIAGSHCIGSVDPYSPEATYAHIEDVPLDAYDAALVCVPDDAKLPLLNYLITHGKHLLVEKPLFSAQEHDLVSLISRAQEKQIVCYTAYNHRFEPHIVRMKQLLESGALGTLYACRLFYGNGTARDVQNSPWRDQKAGVITDLGSHLLDMVAFWFGEQNYAFERTRSFCFENKSPDHAQIHSSQGLPIDIEMSLLSYRNSFRCDIVGELGTAHIDSLCKWGPTTFTHRSRTFPSGRPEETKEVLVKPDPTWQAEYDYFVRCIETGTFPSTSDMWIQQTLNAVCGDLLTEAVHG